MSRASPEAVAARLREGGLEAVSAGGPAGGVEGVARARAGGPLVVAAAAEFVDPVRLPLPEGTHVLVVRVPAAWGAKEVAPGVLQIVRTLEGLDYRPHVAVLEPVGRRPRGRRTVEMKLRGG